MIKISGIILLVDDGGLKVEKPYETDLFGKPMYKWCEAVIGAECPVFHFHENVTVDALPELIRGGINQLSEYTAVLFSDAPLVTRASLLDAVAEMEAKSYNALRLTRGFVFKTEYLLSAGRLYNPPHYFGEEEDFLTASSGKQLALITDILRCRIVDYHLGRGVRFLDTSSTYISCEAEIGAGAVIGPSNVIKGRTVIEAGAVLEYGNEIDCSFIGAGCKISRSVITGSRVEKNCTVGPYAYIRPGSQIGEGCRIGDFVEIKKSSLGAGCKVSHLSYVGDAKLGKNCNVGCGVVFANYDGKNKHETIAGDNVFIGSNSNLVAPLSLADNCFIAAGSTITASVPENALAIARGRQVVKTEWKRPE